MSDCIQAAMLGVQILALVALVCYAVETMKIRRASQQQVEGMSKPCLTLWGDLRDGADVILAMEGAVGNIIAAANEGGYVVQNIGNGVALNVRYHFTRPNEVPAHPPDARYIPHISPTGRVRLVETIGGYNVEHEVTFEYESIGGRKYRTAIHLNHRVLTDFRFEEVSPA